MGVARLVCIAGLAVGGAACSGDKAATLTVPSVLALGTYGPVEFGDACRGSKADLCSAERVQQLESITVQPTGMLEIIPVAEVPADLLQVTKYETAYAAHGLARGSGEVCMQARFSDGTHRKTCVPAAVDEIARVTTALACGSVVDAVSPQPLVPPGVPLQFRVQFQAASGTPLVGDTLHPVEDTAFSLLSAETYVWSSAAGAAVTFGSRLDPSFSETLATYGPTDVTAIHAAITLRPPLVLNSNQAMNFIVGEDVGDRRACLPTPFTVRSDTPDVCTGEKGATVWTAGASEEAWFTTASGGACHLSLGVPGGNGDLGTLDVEYDVVDPAGRQRDHQAGEVCAMQDQRACSRDRSSVLVCRAKTWTVATSCGATICDYVTLATDCSDPAGCAACR